mmetsp:Transcript_41655/g.99873  ORF Transcript_41655/g.99873 Transcript_41655/m.99873 type:complete len:175 (-) Transcript_41655:3298-3822(-)
MQYQAYCTVKIPALLLSQYLRYLCWNVVHNNSLSREYTLSIFAQFLYRRGAPKGVGVPAPKGDAAPVAPAPNGDAAAPGAPKVPPPPASAPNDAPPCCPAANPKEWLGEPNAPPPLPNAPPAPIPDPRADCCPKPGDAVGGATAADDGWSETPNTEAGMLFFFASAWNICSSFP